jgi:Uma2 family endonuclease
MASVSETRVVWTVEDLLDRLGPMSLIRIRFDPTPGTATEDDHLAIIDREEKCRLELYDGMLVEKPMGLREAQARLSPTFVDWTVEDLLERFGPMPLDRLRFNAIPGNATEDDLLAILDREKRLLELVDGFLVEKTMGWLESYLAGWILTHLNIYVRAQGLGVVAGADGMYRMNPKFVRLPDVSFIPLDRLPNRRVPEVRVCPFIPSLAVEVLSKNNTRKEMDGKLIEYFECGVLLVWYVDAAKKTVRVYTSPETSILLDRTQSLDGGDVLPGFSLRLSDLFDDPIAQDLPS